MLSFVRMCFGDSNLSEFYVSRFYLEHAKYLKTNISKLHLMQICIVRSYHKLYVTFQQLYLQLLHFSNVTVIFLDQCDIYIYR